MQMQPRKLGFTLIEVSIVLAIIALVVGGVLGGRHLIRVAELQNLVTEKQRFTTAMAAFKGKYKCRPGDCANATQHGFANNGNGDGNVDGAEVFYLMAQLAQAGLIADMSSPGELLTIDSGLAIGSYRATPGRNIPGLFSGMGYLLVTAPAPGLGWCESDTVNGYVPPLLCGKTMVVLGGDGGHGWAHAGIAPQPILSCDDIMSIEAKVDDTRPFTGSVNIGADLVTTNCYNLPSNNPGDYRNASYVPGEQMTVLMLKVGY